MRPVIIAFEGKGAFLSPAFVFRESADESL